MYLDRSRHRCTRRICYRKAWALTFQAWKGMYSSIHPCKRLIPDPWIPLPHPFHQVLEDPSTFLLPAPHLRATLQKFADAGKQLFLCSNSGYTYVDGGLRYLLGNGKWKLKREETRVAEATVAEVGKRE